MTASVQRVMPAARQVQHQQYLPGATDHRGNPIPSYADPVTRQVIGFYRPGNPTDPISVDYMARIIAEIMMLTYEPTVYNKLDNVLIWDGAETLAYEVQGNPISWSVGYPWERYAPLLAGEVHIRRVQ
jgi:hypothetical protein